MSIQTHCDAGCQKAFEFEAFQVVKLDNDIEKLFFTCPHCQQEYVAHYTDTEIRELQGKIRRVQQRFANPRADHARAARQEARIQKQIKEKMDALKQRVEQNQRQEGE